MLHIILIRARSQLKCFNKINTREGMWGETGKHRRVHFYVKTFVIFNEAIYKLLHISPQTIF